jgi:hypothetical protein
LKVNRRKKQIKLSMKALEEPPQDEYVLDEDEDDIKEETPTAFEAAIRKAMESKGGDSELEDLFSGLEN